MLIVSLFKLISKRRKNYLIRFHLLIGSEIFAKQSPCNRNRGRSPAPLEHDKPVAVGTEASWILKMISWWRHLVILAFFIIDWIKISDFLYLNINILNRVNGSLTFRQKIIMAKTNHPPMTINPRSGPQISLKTNSRIGHILVNTKEEERFALYLFN